MGSIQKRLARLEVTAGGDSLAVAWSGYVEPQPGVIVVGNGYWAVKPLATKKHQKKGTKNGRTQGSNTCKAGGSS